ncbi:cation-transporting P-type ATPase [Clostridium bovifaecis]|uniref:Cation-transporting P-type ATPase n=1 Tax=Clostridium bovifaecis TaxID=2184719 RepID=A0A6I6EPD1_9CLOT|nr:cation-transporting P-type ATPase [Clostridium bovifaecis]
MRAWYNSSWNEVVRELESDFKYGLTEDRVKQNRKNFGDNKTLNLKNKSFIILFLKHMSKLYCILGILITIFLFYTYNWKSAAFLCCTTLFSMLLYAIKDYKNENRLNNLRSITPQKADVVREGKLLNLKPEELVVGDIVCVEKGDIVPADLRIIECEELKVKESAISGDIKLVEKYETKIEDKELLPSDMKNILFKSSFVIEGSAKGIVVEVGENTEIGKITKDLLEENHEKSLLEESISDITNLMSKVFTFSIVLIGIYAIYAKINLAEFMELVSTIYLSLVPMHIMIIVALISLIVRKKMKESTIEIGELSSMQMLAQTNVVFVNKVGTLTEENMFVKKLFSDGEIMEINSESLEESKDNIDRMINIGLLCNDAKVNDAGKIDKGEVIERAIIEYGKENSLHKRILEREQERVFQVPEDWDKRVKTTLNRIEDKYRANVIGAVDKLLERCTHIMKNGMEVEITPKDIIDIRDADLALSEDSLYVVGFAYRNFGYQPSINENIESNLVFVGLMGFDNPLKENSVECIEYCKRLAVKPVVITDDNKIAANSVGKKLGILNKNDVALSGVEIDNMEDNELEKMVERVGIYSKISSKNKWKACSEFEKLGYNIAVTGNKFTDLPSFRAAKVGIATGKECTQITKNLGDVFIEDKDFGKLLSLIDTSRKLTRSIRDIILFNLVIAFIEFFSIIMVNIFFKQASIGFGEILWINFMPLVLCSLLIYTQNENIEGNSYEASYIDKRIFNKFNSGIILYIICVTALSVIGLIIQGKKGMFTGNIIIFTILNISPIMFSFYFVKLKDVIKNKMSSLIMVLNVIFYGVFFKISYSDYLMNLNKLLWDLKVIIVFLLIHIFLIKFIKETDIN